MSDSDYFEFGVAHDRRYTLEHLWLQLLDEKDGTVKVGMSEFLRADYGDVVRVILPHPQDTSEFVLDDEGTAGPRDDGEEDSSPETLSSHLQFALLLSTGYFAQQSKAVLCNE